MDGLYPLLLLIALALTSIPSIAVELSPSPSHQPANAPSPGADLEESVRINGAPPPSNKSANNSGNPPCGFDGGFNEPYQRMTILISALFIATLAIGFCTHYVALRPCHVMRRGGDREGELGAGQGQWQHEEGGGRGGLEPWIVRSLPTMRYEAARSKEGERISDEEAGQATIGVVRQECAVCLSEFEEGEEMKALPQCGHAFHSACIDMWLFSHTTCPICRLSLLKKAVSKREPNSSSRGLHPTSRNPLRHDSPEASPPPWHSPPPLAVPLSSGVTAGPAADPSLSASTSMDLRNNGKWHDQIDNEMAKDARTSCSAALFPRFLPSS